MLLLEIFSRASRDRRALKALHANPAPTRFDITWAAMRAAILEARDDLATGKLRHIHQADEAAGLGRCFNVGIHRLERSDHSIVGLAGLVEQKLRLNPTAILDVMRDASDNSLWDLFYPAKSPNAIDCLTPQDTVLAIDRWLAKSDDVWSGIED